MKRSITFIFVVLLLLSAICHSHKKRIDVNWQSFTQKELEEKVKNILYEISASYQSNSLAFYDYEEFGVVFEVQTVRGNKEFIKLHYPCDKLACNMSCPEEIKILKSLDRYYKKRLNSYRYILEWKEANGVWLHTIPWQPITLDEFLVDRKNEIHQNDRYIKNIIAQVIQEAAVLERAGWVHNAIKFQNLLLSHSAVDCININDGKQLFVFLTNFSHATGYYKYRKDLDARAFPTVCQTIEISSPTPADDTWDIGIVFLQLVMPEGYELSSSFSGDIMQKLSEQYVYSHPADILTYFLCWQPLYPSLNFKYISLYQYAFGDAHRLFKGSETKHCLSRRGFEFMCKMFETDRDRRLWPSQLLKESYLKKTVKDLKKLKAATKEKERKKTLGVVRDDSTNKLIIRKLD